MGTLRGSVSGRHGLNTGGERGATAVEYGLMVAFIALVIIVSVISFGKSVLGLFDLVTSTAPFSN